MPTGKVRFYDVGKHFGFIDYDGDKTVYFPASSLPQGHKTLAKDTKVEFSLIDTHKGLQAINVVVKELPPSLVKAQRPAPAQMVSIVQDLSKLLDNATTTLRRQHYPAQKDARQLAKVLRYVADCFDVQE